MFSCSRKSCFPRTNAISVSHQISFAFDDLRDLWGCLFLWIFAAFFTAEKCFRNEPGSRISSNLRTPDHLGWISGTEHFCCLFYMFFGPKSCFSIVFLRFWSPGTLPEWSRSILGTLIFADFRWIPSEFSGVARFLSNIAIIHGNSE